MTLKQYFLMGVRKYLKRNFTENNMRAQVKTPHINTTSR